MRWRRASAGLKGSTRLQEGSLARCRIVNRTAQFCGANGANTGRDAVCDSLTSSCDSCVPACAAMSFEPRVGRGAKDGRDEEGATTRVPKAALLAKAAILFLLRNWSLWL
jgi:hypothetical protein